MLENTDRKAAGRVTKVFLHDINGDGEDDFLFYTNTEDVTKIGNLYGVIHTNNGIQHIYVSPFMRAPYVDGYLGRTLSMWTMVLYISRFLNLISISFVKRSIPEKDGC